MIEASEVDSCGHGNDIVCLLSMLKWEENDTETLVVMLSDHETGGMTVDRDGSFYNDESIRYWDGTQPRNGA